MRERFRCGVVALVAGLLVLAPGASWAARDVRPEAVLDPSFGSHGVRRLPPKFAFTAYGVATRSGDLLVSGGSRVRVLDDHGGIGEAFGDVGSLTLPPARGEKFQLGDFTVDRHGRLLVVGGSVFPESENPSPISENGGRAFFPEVVRILRLLPDGRLDPAFGRGGVVETDLGLPPPVGAEGEPLGTRPAVRATGVAVDRRGRIVVTGSAVVRLGESCEHDSFAPVAVSAGFVARFTGSGAPDTSFGRDGLVGGHGLGENALGAEAIGEPVVGPRGGITYRSISAYPCERGRSHFGIAQLTPDGRTSRAFGRKGAMVGPYSAMASLRDGSVVALAEGFRRREGEDLKARLIRVAPDGKPDRSFGEGGQTTMKFGHGIGITLDSLTVDRRGRILVGGTLGIPRGRSIVLLRVSARGRWEKNFGPHGRVATRVRQLAQSEPSDLFLDRRGRLVTLHRYARKGHSGLVVARYLLRNRGDRHARPR